jgi:hypothetical protein
MEIGNQYGYIKIDEGDMKLAASIYHTLIPAKNEMLSMGIEELRHFYRKVNWIHYNIPYELIANAENLLGSGWLNLKWKQEPFELPLELIGHRDEMVQEFQKRGRLRQGPGGLPDNQICPRVIGFDNQRKELTLQQAVYFDQVATNLCMDFRLQTQACNYGHTIREIDRNYIVNGKHLQEKKLANEDLTPFKESFLANTLGVACMIVFKNGEVFYRLRSEKTAVYGNKAHVPVSFAQEVNINSTPPWTLEELVMPDLRVEFNQETRLEYGRYISKAIPLGFCRDIQRGGKPQLFLLLESSCDTIQFTHDLQEASAALPVREYSKKPIVLNPEKSIDNMSTELAGGLYLYSQVR